MCLIFLADDIPELLSSSSLFSMLLPLLIAYIGPVAAAIPKVRASLLFCTKVEIKFKRLFHA